MLPDFFDAKSVEKAFTERNSDAVRSMAVHYLATEEGLTNREIRKKLSIAKVYQVTHFKRCGGLTREELELWDRNSTTITLSHIRAIAFMPKTDRLELLRTILQKRLTAKATEGISRRYKSSGNISMAISENTSSHAERYADLMSEYIGRPVRLTFKGDCSGEICIQFFGYSDLSDIALKQGFDDSDKF